MNKKNQLVLTLGLMAAGITSCGGKVVVDGAGHPGTSGQGGDAAGAGGQSAGTGSGLGGWQPVDGGTDGSSIVDATIFVSGNKKIYTIDPSTQLIVTSVALSGCDSGLNDIAVNRTGLVFGVTAEGFYKIEPQNGVCTLIKKGEYTNSLAFTPDNGSSQEKLIGYRDSSYIRIDPDTGVTEVVGSLASGYVSSGDIIATNQGRLYATVKGNGCKDCLAEVNPSTGGLINVVGSLNKANIFGLANAQDVIYGFSFDGVVVHINIETAMTTVVPLINATPETSFLGAASSLSATSP